MGVNIASILVALKSIGTVTCIQSNNNAQTAVDNLDCAFLSNNSSTNCIVVFVGIWSTGSFSTPAVGDDLTNTYNLVGTAAIGDGSGFCYMWVAPNITNGTNTVHVMGLGAMVDIDVVIAEYSNIQTFSTVDGFVTGGITNTAFGLPTLTTTVANDLLVIGCYDDYANGDTFTIDPPTWIQRTQSSNPDLECAVLADNIGVSTGAYNILVVDGAITPINLSFSPTWMYEVPVIFAVSATGGVAPYTYQITVGSLPTGLSMDSAGNITGTPTTEGVFSFTIKVTDSASTVLIQDESVSIGVNVDLNLPSPNIGMWLASSENFTVTATGGVGPYTFTVTSGAFPTGLSMDSAGNVTGVVTTVGTYNFTIQATDTLSAVGLASGTIIVPMPATPFNQYTVVAHRDFSFGAGSFPLNLSSDLISGIQAGDLVVVAVYFYGDYDDEFGGWDWTQDQIFFTDTLDGFDLLPSTAPWGRQNGSAFLEGLGGGTLDVGPPNYQEAGKIMYWAYQNSGNDVISFTANLSAPVSPQDYLMTYNSAYFSYSVYRFNYVGDTGDATVHDNSILSSPYIPYINTVVNGYLLGSEYNYSGMPWDSCLMVGIVNPGPTVGAGTPTYAVSAGATTTLTADGGGNILYSAQWFAIDTTWNTLGSATLTVPGQPFPSGDPRQEIGSVFLIAFGTQIFYQLPGPPATGTVGISYTPYTYTASGGVPPYTYFIEENTLPPGITLDTETGTISGTPTTMGTYTWAIEVIDSVGETNTTESSLDSATISGGSGGGTWVYNPVSFS